MKPIFDHNYITNILDGAKEQAEKDGDYSGEYQERSKLALEYGVVSDGALDVLHNYPYLRNLRILHCGNVKDADLAPLSKLNRLETLFLAGVSCDGSFLQYVQPRLKYFTFKYSTLNDSNVQFLESLAEIESIRLENCGVGDRISTALASQKLNALWQLAIREGAFHRKIESSMKAPSLDSIDIINSTGCSNITRLFRDLALRNIDLRYSDFSDDDVVCLLETTKKTNRELYLDFSGTLITDDTLGYMSKTNLNRIYCLYLDDTSVTQKGVEALAKGSGSKLIWELGLTDVYDLDLQFIISSFPKLRQLQVSLDLLDNGNIPKKDLILDEQTRRADIYNVKSSDGVQIVFLKETYRRHHELVCLSNRYF